MRILFVSLFMVFSLSSCFDHSHDDGSHSHGDGSHSHEKPNHHDSID